MARKPQPLFRWEYLRQPESNVPCAHFHIHAHRDEAVYLLLTGKGNNARIKRRAAQLDEDAPVVPQLSDLHFPLGGPRFRLCLEDILQFLVEEFGIDCETGWKDAIHQGRADWRRVQLGWSFATVPMRRFGSWRIWVTRLSHRRTRPQKAPRSPCTENHHERSRSRELTIPASAVVTQAASGLVPKACDHEGLQKLAAERVKVAVRPQVSRAETSTVDDDAGRTDGLIQDRTVRTLIDPPTRRRRSRRWPR